MKNQITELLTNYGPVAGTWFDRRSVPSSRPEKRHELKYRNYMIIFIPYNLLTSALFVGHPPYPLLLLTFFFNLGV
ncbi:hypothetical protein, partial [Saccharicrinis sp. GN24d3]|uniref:hypothetical protein n=1 Tax=Saccharicrinis sp. GN24d3 TaxID=3458416 RepID=UPI00403618EF